MPVRLKSRSKHPPGGFVLLLPELGMKSPLQGSFNEMVNAFSQLIRANPGQATQHGWPAYNDWDGLADWIDNHNAARLVALGQFSFVDQDGGSWPDPEFAQKKTSPLIAAGRLVSGAALWAELLGPSGRTVDSTHAARRASVCASCPQNDTATSLFDIFIAAVARGLTDLYGLLRDKKLTTPIDERLGTCHVCKCPLKAKVWPELPHILAHLDSDTKTGLPAHCWIRIEEAAS